MPLYRSSPPPYPRRRLALTIDQVLALAPDASAVAAGKKLGDARPWRALGASERALWGECQGSAVYQVRVDLASLVGKCSCPSRKFPCKHVLGLLVLSVRAPIAAASEPDWVVEWLDKRAASAEAKEKKATQAADAPVDEAGRAKRAERRGARVEKGVEALDLWLRDLIHNGLGGIEAQPPSFWEAQAARLVDAQAPGLAAAVRALAEIPGRGADWPARLLDALGRLALLTHAHARADSLEESLRAEIRQRVGFTVPKDEVLATVARVADEWIVLGQIVEDEPRLRVQRTWLLGAESRALALVLQFAAGNATFEEAFVPGTAFRGEVAFFPGPLAHRALVAARASIPAPAHRIPAHDDFASMLDDVAARLAKLPLLDRTAFHLRGVVPVATGERAFLVDRAGAALPLETPDVLRLLALSGGHPVDVTGEWNGLFVRPLGVVAEGAFHALGGPR